jgi:DNA replication protein DnaC
MQDLNTKDIFLNGVFGDQEPIIKSINIDINAHKMGFFNILKSKVDNYSIDASNKDVLNILFHYFTGNQLFCLENNIDLNKGILLCGGVGTGKSIIMQAFRDYTCEINRVNGFQYHTAIDIIDNVNISGVNYLEKFNHNICANMPNPITCYIDDIASKNEIVKNYGTEISVIEQLISIRYNIFSRYRKLTHFSSNIYPANLKDYYDLRIIDRLKEMCNIISLPGTSRRK